MEFLRWYFFIYLFIIISLLSHLRSIISVLLVYPSSNNCGIDQVKIGEFIWGDSWGPGQLWCSLWGLVVKQLSTSEGGDSVRCGLLSPDPSSAHLPGVRLTLGVLWGTRWWPGARTCWYRLSGHRCCLGCSEEGLSPGLCPRCYHLSPEDQNKVNQSVTVAE